jgi:hypothetical protein
MNFKDKTYTFQDIPEKRQFVFDRTKTIYPDLDDAKIDEILNSIKIYLRDQKEKGASNHLTKSIFVSFKELAKRNVTDEQSLIKYLESPYSPITHETTHIFQNIFEEFPDVQYNKKEDDGKFKIDYKKYVTDEGEIQARLEHIIELLDFGFTKEEIVNFLYSRAYKDQPIWRDLVDKAMKLRKESK